MEQLAFLTPDQVRHIAQNFGTPVFVYDQKTLEKRAAEVLAFPNAFGLTARYAMKALPNLAIIRILTATGLHIDASSGFEAERAMRAGVAPEKIQITAQQIPANLPDLVKQGVLYNACSLHQLKTYGEWFPGTEVTVRINPGLGSGSTNRTNVGGPSSSFGIWHEQLPQIFEIADAHHLRVTGMHTHIGSGSDPNVWVNVAKMTLGIAARMPDVTTLSLGGGYKVARMADEKKTDLQEIGNKVLPEFEAFAKEHGRKLHLEVEPGTYLAANSGAIVCNIIDTVSTGEEGYKFVKVNSGMTEVLRPSLYGAQHPLIVVPAQEEPRSTGYYLVAGHCCESGDILTPAPGDSEGLHPRQLVEPHIGDHLVIEGAGAYCSGMASKHYNSFPEAAEVLLTTSGEFQLVRKAQSLDQVLQNEVV